MIDTTSGGGCAVDRAEKIFQRLKVLNGIDEDLARAYTRLINQIRSALVGTYPEFEHALGGRIIHRTWVLELLARYGGPAKLARSGKARILAFAKRHNARNPQPIVDATFTAIQAQHTPLPDADEAQHGG